MQPDQGQPREGRAVIVREARAVIVREARAVIVHGAADVALTLALAGARPVALLSARGAAAYLGVAGFAALLVPHGAQAHAILDAADAPGHALEGLRAGFRHVVLDPGLPAFAPLAALASGLGATLLPAAPPALDLARVDLAKPQGRMHLARWLDLP
jgi:hypothetical protein